MRKVTVVVVLNTNGSKIVAVFVRKTFIKWKRGLREGKERKEGYVVLLFYSKACRCVLCSFQEWDLVFKQTATQQAILNSRFKEEINKQEHGCVCVGFEPGLQSSSQVR